MIEAQERLNQRPPDALKGDAAGDDYDVRDPVLAVLIDVQRRKLDNLGALYRIRRLVARGWPYSEWEAR